VTTTFLCRVLASLALGKAFAECLIKGTRQRHLCRPKFYRGLFAECGTRQSLYRVQNSLCRVPPALSKEPDSSSVAGKLDLRPGGAHQLNNTARQRRRRRS
jgi:hypothetical protein